MSPTIATSCNSLYSLGSDKVRLTLHERVTAKINSLLERGVRPWTKPWDDTAPSDASVLPLRFCVAADRRINIFALWATLRSPCRSCGLYQ